MKYIYTRFGIFYVCRVTGTWQPVCIVNGVFYPIAITAF